MTTIDSPSAGISRRDFIRFGLIGGAVVASGATLSTLTGCARESQPASGFRHLRDSDLTLLRPLAPWLLAGAFEPTPANVDHALRQMDLLLDSAVPGARAELYKLLDGLHLAPMRWFLTSSWRAFDKQTPEQLRDTVRNWSERGIGLSRLALRAICQPLVWGWYLTEEGVRHTGYPGTPKKVVTA
ncbi:Tat pathway signal protein [Alcanivorax quisquiliarum]|uniref:Tat pathway signal protein n=1 Tax=Alcanivorax quisquiliarum TaxID=2933565 RepID=A0ABT0E5D6_9GAMM|nr:Tat pathway signal protein [Alcanivorax quisquiliarum]MCK0537002.1 Tat pathway signal protein [Alcanivorax quisquiliarum]